MNLKFNREKFFQSYRAAFGSLTQSQVDGINFLLDKLEGDDFTLAQAAYILATVDHETAHKFQPIKEYRAKAGSKGRANQDRYWLKGEYGRGFVQLTWDRNYRKFGLDPDERDKALEPETAYMILSRGMRDGMFTGKKLSDFVNDKADFKDFKDFKEARRVINGTDKAELIAGRAQKFQSALTAAARDSEGVHITHISNAEDQKPATQEVTVQPTVAEDKTSKKSLRAMIGAAVAAVTAWISANVGEAFGYLKNLDVNQFLKWLMIIGGAILIIYLIRQIVKMIITQTANMMYNLRTMEYHANPETNNVKLGSPAPREPEE